MSSFPTDVPLYLKMRLLLLSSISQSELVVVLLSIFSVSVVVVPITLMPSDLLCSLVAP